MIRPDQLLRTLLETLRRASGAQRATLYLPAVVLPAREPLLVSAGEGEVVPELADLEQASQLSRQDGDGDPAGTGSPWAPLPSRVDDALLFRLPPLERLVELVLGAEESGRRRDRRRGQAELLSPRATWLGLRYGDDTGSLTRLRETLEASERQGFEGGTPAEALPWLLALVGSLAGQAWLLLELLQDPNSRLLGRSELQRLVSEALRQAHQEGRTLALLLVNPDDFAALNESFGRAAGDRVIRQIAERLQGGVRKSDLVGRYGGVVFAVLLGNVGGREAVGIARKLVASLREPPYSPHDIYLEFSVGVAQWEPEEDGGDSAAALELMRRADRALSAAKTGERSKLSLWDPTLGEGAGPVDRLLGIFTGDIGRDYRNMLILWDTVAAATASTDFTDLVRRICRRVVRALCLARLAVVAVGAGGSLRLLTTEGGDPTGDEPGGEAFDGWLGDSGATLVRRAIERRSVEAGEVTPPGRTGPHRGLVVPLVSGGRCGGAIYAERGGERVPAEVSDDVFLRALADQLAAAQERARRDEEASRRRERERRQVRTELAQLRRVLGDDQLVYRSGAMESLLETARRVAVSDATVLISGESGTGKELLARTLHAMSPRRDKPLVVVDCTTLPPSLVESELFGHERGAFTGADRRTTGRLDEAAGGTLVLDEVGELPPEAQSRLLRLVQEKSYTRVGETRPRRLDARIVAVTNRDLAEEVAAGRFREDLYYRLNVVQLVLPPLRQRPEDIEFLTEHFLERYARQHDRPMPQVGPAAWTVLERYRWPGNVRELQNRLLRALLLSGDSTLEPVDLGFESGPAGPGAPGRPSAGTTGEALPGEDPWDVLRRELAGQVDSCLAADGVPPYPLFDWLVEDLVLAADRAAGGVRTHAAARLGLPETSFRRHLEQARAAQQEGRAFRVAGWERMARPIRAVVAESSTDLNALEHARDLLLAGVLERLPADSPLGARLMGVTPPTFAKWVERLARQRPDLVPAHALQE